MMEYIATFAAVFFLDICYTYYLKCVQNEDAMGASLWSVALYLAGCVAVIGYTANHWLLIPAILGGFFGTYVGMKIRK